MGDELVWIFCPSINQKNLELLDKVLKSQGFEVDCGNSIEELDSALKAGAKVKAALLDIARDEKNIRERCDQLRQRGIPFIILYPKQKGEITAPDLSYGASGLQVKPVVIKELLTCLRSLTESRNE